MIRLPVNKVQPGMKVGRNVYNAHGHILLRAGIFLTKKYIDRLKLLGISSIYIDDGLSPDIKVHDIISEKLKVDVTTKVRKIFSGEESNSAPLSKNIVILKDIGNTINKIIDQLLASQDIVVNLIDIRTMDEYTYWSFS